MLTSITLGSLLMGLALVVIVLLFLARPLVEPEEEAEQFAPEELDELLLRKDTLLRQIRELDEDMEMAKVAPELYQQRRPQLVQQAAVVMQRLDALGYGEAPAAPADVPADLDAQIEAAVKRIRTPQEVDDDIEAAVQRVRAREAAPAKATVAAATKFCPQCGRRVDANDRFCPACGTNLTQEPSKSARAARA